MAALKHKQLLIAVFAVLALYAGAIVVAKHDDALAVQKAFFDHAPSYAYVSWAIMVLVPASCVYIAVALYKNHHWGFYVLPAAHAVFILGVYGAIPVVYLVWWHVTSSRATAP